MRTIDPQQFSILGAIIVATIILAIPNVCKLPASVTTENLGILNMPLRYYIILAILVYITFAHLTLLPDTPMVTPDS